MSARQVIYWSAPDAFQQQETLYLRARRAENRVPEDDWVRQLPHTPAGSTYHREWQMRKRSFHRFQRYLNRQFPSTMRLLDLGCGNGWMSNRLAENNQWEVWAVDVNAVEMEQGARLFGRQNLHFYYADILQNPLPDQHFQVIVLAASVQYFPDLKKLIQTLKKALLPGGEIHLIDSPLYPDATSRAAAADRTRSYFEKIGVPEMAAFYHHHWWEEVQALGGENLNKGLKIKILQKVKILPPFPWIRFRL